MFDRQLNILFDEMCTDYVYERLQLTTVIDMLL